MTDKQDRHDDIHLISQKMKSITTIDPNLNISDQAEPTMSKVKNNTSTNSMQKMKTCSYGDYWSSQDLPGKNLPEKILFVIDTAKEPDCTLFEARTGGKFSPLYMIKRVVEIFVNAKSGIQPKHEYALMSLKSDRVAWNCEFTNNRKTFLASLEKIEEDPVLEEREIFDMGPCFGMICGNVDLEDMPPEPEFVFRVILVYARSRTIPTFFSGQHFFERLSKHSHFYLDCLYVHEPLNEDNDCQNVYSKLGALDVHQTSYILEAGRNLATLHTNMAKLIAHPLQRARQDDSPYNFCNLESSQDA